MSYLPSHYPIDPPVQSSNTTGAHFPGGGGGVTATPIYTDRVGRWMYYVAVEGNFGSNADDQGISITCRINGGDRRFSRLMIQNFANTGIAWGWGTYEDMAASTQWYCTVGVDYWLSGDLTLYQFLFFVPTQTHPGLF